uniref:EIF-4F 25 kDa subunit n=1 Tax=Schistocephalus solidus TaxID=70667 RepID=A0A0X3P7B6_SCHSO
MAAVKPQPAILEKDEEGDTDVHPLQYAWNFFVFSYSAGKGWEDNMQKIAVFDTVEHFWSILTHTLPPSEIMNGTDIYIFKDGIQPMWEDERNRNGGRWLINVPHIEMLDTYWEELLMLIIGNDWETEAESEQICGAVFQRRARGPKISLWTSDAEDEATVMRIGRRVKDRLKFPDRLSFQTVYQQQNVPKGRDSGEGKYFV